MANETVLFKRGDSATITSTPVTDGQILFDTSGNGKMYLDNGTDRLEMGGALTVDATLSKTSTNPVQNRAVAGVMLDTLSDIGNVTSKGFLTDALAVKELNTNVNELNNSLGKSDTENISSTNAHDITITTTETPIGYDGLLIVHPRLYKGWSSCFIYINKIPVFVFGKGDSSDINSVYFHITQSFRVKSTDTIYCNDPNTGGFKILSAKVYEYK